MISKTWDRIKDKGVDILLQSALNFSIKEYGEITSLNLNSKKSSLNLEVILKGELEELKIDIGKYELIKIDNLYYIKVYKVKTSREWLNIVLPKYIEGKKIKIPIPEKYRDIIDKLIN